MTGITQDLRHSARGLLRDRAFAVAAILTLGITIGANVLGFTVINAVILQPLPLPEPDRLMTFWLSAPARGTGEVNVNDAFFALYRERTRVFEDIAGHDNVALTLTGAGEAEHLNAARVTTNYFTVLRQEPDRGRGFVPEEGKPGVNRVAILSDGFWQRRFGADPNVVGQVIHLDRVPTTVIGIMRPGFDFPNPAERPGTTSVDLWIPLVVDPADFNNWNYSTVGRLKPGGTAVNAERELAAMWEAFVRDQPAATLGPGSTPVVTPLKQKIIGQVQTPLWVLFGAVILVLVIACANIANLYLTRANTRRRELVVRVCLGADFVRVVRQMFTETLLTALLGAALGFILASMGLATLRGLSIGVAIPRLALARLDHFSVLFTGAVGVLVGLILGLALAWRSSQLNLQEIVREGGVRGSMSRSSRRLNDAFVVVQFATSLVLVIGAVMLLQSFVRLMAVDPGFRADHVVTARLALPTNKYVTDAQVRTFYERLLDHAKLLPGVGSAALCQVVPFSGGGGGAPFVVEGQEPKPGEPAPDTWWRSVSPDYFTTMGIRVMRGRVFEERDGEDSTRVAIVDEKLADAYWPGQDPIGKRVRIGTAGSKTPSWLTVVGVVASVKNRNLDENAKFYVYQPSSQWVRRSTSLVIRASGDPAALIPTLKRELAILDSELPLFEVTTIEQAVARSLAMRRLLKMLLIGFAVTALILAAIGMYGVLSLAVNSRKAEFAIRMALGGQPDRMLRTVVGHAMRLVLVGTAVGVAAAFWLTGLLDALLFDVQPTDPAIFATAAVMLSAVALTACYLPARRAARVDPLVTLRYD